MERKSILIDEQFDLQEAVVLAMKKKTDDMKENTKLKSNRWQS